MVQSAPISSRRWDPSGRRRSPYLFAIRPNLDSVIAAQAREPNGGLIVIPDDFLNVHRAEIILQAARYNLPAVYPWRFFAEQDGLLSYGSEQRDIFRLAASYVDRILRGRCRASFRSKPQSSMSW